MRRFLAAALCLLLLIPLISGFNYCYAADSYLITIAEETVLEGVSDSEMAVYLDGIIYAPYTVLESINNVYVTYNKDHQKITVYCVGASIQFDLQTGQTLDTIQQRPIAVAAKMRGGVPYLPVSVVTAWMGMYFSFTPAADSGVGYPVIRLAGSANPASSDAKVFREKAEALSRVAQARDRLSGIGVVTSEPPPPPPVLPMRDVSLLFLGMEEDAPLDELLSTLTRVSLPAAFFLSEEEMAGGEQLRTLCAQGFTTGIWLTDPEDPLAQAQRVSEFCAQEAHLRIRLVCAFGLALTPEQEQALAEAGFVLWTATYDPYSRTNRSLMTNIRSSLYSAPTRSTLRLKVDQDTLTSLPLLYSYLAAQNFTALPVAEWTEPFS